MGIIYKIQNNINGKIYIGQTIRSLKIRFQKHCRFSSISIGEANMPIKKAIKKYGKQNFTITEIESVDDSLLNEREIFWIKYYDSYNNGYNATIGGALSGKPKTISDENEIIIISKYLNGSTPNFLAKEYHVDRKTIMNLFSRNNIKTRSIVEACSKGFISDDYIKQLLSEGKSQRQIAKIINRSQSTVWQRIKRLENNIPTSVQVLTD